MSESFADLFEDTAPIVVQGKTLYIGTLKEKVGMLSPGYYFEVYASEKPKDNCFTTYKEA